MKNLKRYPIFILILIIPVISFSQDIKPNMFKTAEEKKLLADKNLAFVLSPEAYEDASDYYEEAKSDFEKGGEINKINENLNNSIRYFEKSIENIDLAKLTFTNALNARNDALEANANKYQQELWDKAEETLKDAAKELHKGDLDDAKKEQNEAETLYREAELASIKTIYLDNARKLLVKAEDIKAYKNAPVTFELANKYLRESEKALGESRYDTDKPRNLAKQAEYEANHAIYLHQTIEKLEDQDMTYEGLIRMSEEYINLIANAMNSSLKFDKGLEGPVQSLVDTIEQFLVRISDLEGEVINLTDYSNSQKTLLDQKNEEINLLNQQLESTNEEYREKLQAQIETSFKKQKQLEDQMALNKKREEKYNTIKDIFSPKEAIVFRDGDDVVIRLVGFNFDVGKSEIKPEHFAVLTKVQEASKVFENDQVIIQGHTDSQGGDDVNMDLSQKRADAVLAYLQANMNLNNTDVKAIGYGESQPVANNETREGRAKNRRIDIIIKPK